MDNTEKKNSIIAICHNHQNIVSGTVQRISETGCELVSHVESSDSVFPQKCSVLLNLLEEQSGRTVNVAARLTRAVRQDGTWVYRIRWKKCPELLAA